MRNVCDKYYSNCRQQMDHENEINAITQIISIQDIQVLYLLKYEALYFLLPDFYRQLYSKSLLIVAGLNTLTYNCFNPCPYNSVGKFSLESYHIYLIWESIISNSQCTTYIFVQSLGKMYPIPSLWNHFESLQPCQK